MNDAMVVRKLDACDSDRTWRTWVNLSDMVAYVSAMLDDPAMDWRLGQAVYNVLRSLRQDGLPQSWPALFYRTHNWEKAIDLLDSVFDIEDGYLIPKT